MSMFSLVWDDPFPTHKANRYWLSSPQHWCRSLADERPHTSPGSPQDEIHCRENAAGNVVWMHIDQLRSFKVNIYLCEVNWLTGRSILLQTVPCRHTGSNPLWSISLLFHKTGPCIRSSLGANPSLPWRHLNSSKTQQTPLPHGWPCTFGVEVALSSTVARETWHSGTVNENKQHRQDFHCNCHTWKQSETQCLI